MMLTWIMILWGTSSLVFTFSLVVAAGRPMPTFEESQELAAVLDEEPQLESDADGVLDSEHSGEPWDIVAWDSIERRS